MIDGLKINDDEQKQIDRKFDFHHLSLVRRFAHLSFEKLR